MALLVPHIRIPLDFFSFHSHTYSCTISPLFSLKRFMQLFEFLFQQFLFLLFVLRLPCCCDNTPSPPPPNTSTSSNHFDILGRRSSNSSDRSIAHFFIAIRNTIKGVGGKRTNEQTNNMPGIISKCKTRSYATLCISCVHV